MTHNFEKMLKDPSQYKLATQHDLDKAKEELNNTQQKLDDLEWDEDNGRKDMEERYLNKRKNLLEKFITTVGSVLKETWKNTNELQKEVDSEGQGKNLPEWKIIADNFNAFWLNNHQSIALVREQLGVDKNVENEKFSEQIKEYQKKHNIDVTGKIERSILIEIKAGIILNEFEKWDFKNGIPEKKQEEIELVLNNHRNILWLNFIWNNKPGLLKHLAEFRKTPTWKQNYDKFFHYLDHFFDNHKPNERPLTKLEEQRLTQNTGTLLWKWWLLSVIKGDMTKEQFIKNHWDAIENVWWIVLILSAIFWIPKSIWKEIPGWSNWYTRIPLLVGFTALGGWELVWEAYKATKDTLLDGILWETSDETNKPAIQKIVALTGDNTKTSQEKLVNIHSHVNEWITNEKQKEKNNILSNIFLTDLWNKRIEEIDNIWTIVGLHLTQQNQNKLEKAGISDTDLQSFIQILTSKNLDKTKTIHAALIWPETINQAVNGAPHLNNNSNEGTPNTNVAQSSLISFEEKNNSESILWNGNEYNSNETYNEFREQIIQQYNSPKVKLIMAVSQIWIDGARSAKDEQWGLMWLNNDKDIIQSWINNVGIQINELFSVINDRDHRVSDIDTIINTIFRDIGVVESTWEDILDNIEEIEDLFDWLNENNYETRLAKVLKLSAGWWRDGNTEKSKSITQDIILNKYFSDANNTINSIVDIDSMEPQIFMSLWLTRSEAQEVIKETQKTYTKVKSATEKHRDVIVENFELQNPDFVWNQMQEVNKIIAQAALQQAKKIASSLFLTSSIDQLSIKDPIVDTFRDLDSFSQKSQEWLADNGLMIALSLIPIWAWFAAVWALAKWASFLSRWRTLAQYWNTAKFAGNSLKWVTFYQGMNLTNNALYQNEISMDLLNGSLDSKEMIKSALFFNVMWVVSKFIPKWSATISPQNLKSISAEVFGFTGVDIWVEFAHSGEMSVEQFMNSLTTWVLFTAISRWAWRISQSSRWVEFGAKNIQYQHKTLKNPDGSPKLYTQKPDGKIYGADGKIKNVKTQNLEKINPMQQATDLFKIPDFKKWVQKSTDAWNKIKNTRKVIDGKMHYANIGSYLEKLPLVWKAFANEKVKKTLTGAWVLSAITLSDDEVSNIMKSFTNNEKAILSMDNLENIGAIVWNFYFMKKLWLISTLAYHEALQALWIKDDWFVDQIF